MPEPKADDLISAPNGRALELTVAALRNPATYPAHVERIEAIETHMSWVFLTEHHAYKLKKPMWMPSFDHTTLRARRTACQLELELNRRLAPDVYLAVVPLVLSNGVLRLEADGEPIDWLVKMRRQIVAMNVTVQPPGLNSYYIPIDGGLTLRGQPLFGHTKTWRGIVVAVGGCILGAACQRYLLEPRMLLQDFILDPTRVTVGACRDE